MSLEEDNGSKLRAAETTRREAATAKVVTKSIQLLIDQLTKGIELIDNDLSNLVESDDEGRAKKRSAKAHLESER